MTLILLDQISVPGDAARPNEDAFAHGPRAALVIDGATPLGETLMPGPSDAAWLAQFGARRLMAHLKNGDDPIQALTHALGDTEKSFTALRRRAVREKWETPCASMMLISESDGGAEFLWYGDCAALLLQDGACEIIGDAFDRRKEEARRARRIALEKNLAPASDFNRPEIISVLRASRNHINSGDNWLFSPDPRAAKHVSCRKCEVAPGSVLMIASDGFLALATDYGIYDAEGLISAARAKGFSALGEELRAFENADALGEKFTRFKKSDDATALLLEVI